MQKNGQLSERVRAEENEFIYYLEKGLSPDYRAKPSLGLQHQGSKKLAVQAGLPQA